MTPAVALADVTIERGGRRLVSGASLEIAEGSLVALVGPNGSGKTTLLRVLLGLLPVEAGQVRVLGREPRRGDAAIGYVPQRYAAEAAEAVRSRDLVALGLPGRRFGSGLVGRDDRARVHAALVATGVADLADRRLSELSGGQQQRVAIAAALAGEPRLLLLDEPLANLDVAHQRDLVALLAGLRDTGTTVVVVTHDLVAFDTELDGVIELDGEGAARTGRPEAAR